MILFIAAPMTKLTQSFIGECERCLQDLKSKLTSTPVLIISESTKGYAVYCDASGVGLGCVLMKHEKFIAYGLRQLQPH